MNIIAENGAENGQGNAAALVDDGMNGLPASFEDTQQQQRRRRRRQRREEGSGGAGGGGAGGGGAGGAGSGGDLSVISAQLACAACALTFREMGQRGAPLFAASPRAAAIAEELATLPPALARPAPHVERYLAFLEREIPRIERLELGRHALPWVLRQQGLVSDDGLWLEFGVAKGTSLCAIAAEGRRRGRVAPVYGFDSFEGLPTQWRVGFDTGKFTQNGTPPTLPDENDNVAFVVGLFADTLPGFLASATAAPRGVPVSLLHVDCDLYAGAAVVLELLSDRIVPGTVIVFDELLNYNGYERHEMRALFEFLERRCDLAVRWLGMKNKGCMSVALVMVGK
jgi:hypothetical protein